MELKLTHDAKLDTIEAKQDTFATDARANQDRTCEILARLSAGQESHSRALEAILEFVDKKKVEEFVSTS